MSLADRLIHFFLAPMAAKMEKLTKESADWSRDLLDSSPKGAMAFALTMPMVRFEGTAPARLRQFARLGAIRAEDCGPCVRIEIRFARARHIADEDLRAALNGVDGALSGLDRAAYDFGHAIAANGDTATPRAVLLPEIGESGIADLTISAAAVRLFPALKRGLGHAQSCDIDVWSGL